MRRRRNTHQQICAVALATVALIMSAIGINVTENVLTSEPEGISISLDTSPAAMTVTQQQLSTVVIKNFTPIASELVQTIMAENNNNVTSSSATSTTSTTITTTTTRKRYQNIFNNTQSLGAIATTIRPLIVPTLPEFRHRVTHSRTYPSKHHHEHHWGPFFEEPLNATTGALQVGIHLATEAVLNCRVGMLKDKTVMWVRKTTDKVSLLTVGNNTYSGDPRIRVKFQYPNNWRLHINPVQREDAGLYMCQVSTHPPRVFATNVTVLAPAIRVVDEHGHEVHDRYYKMGSAIELTCQVAVSFLSVLPTVMPGPNPPQFPFIPKSFNFTIPTIATATTTASTTTATTSSLHPSSVETVAAGAAGAVMTSSTLRIYGFHGIIATTTEIPVFPQIPSKQRDIEKQYDYFHQKLLWRKDGERLPKDVQLNLSATPEWRSSRLSIPAADRIHSGVYSCSILNSSTAVVHVQVLNGEMPAAVQHNSGEIKKTILPTIILLIFCFPLLHISC